MSLGAGDRILIIAEMAGAHGGDAARAERIIDAAAAGHADAVKVHLYTPDELAVPSFSAYPLYHTLQLGPSVWRALFGRAHGLGLQVFADVFGLDSARAAQAYGADGFKIHTADVANRALLETVGRSGRSVLLSVGGSTWIETAEALAVLREAGAVSPVLMLGFQGYPTAFEHSHVRRIAELRAKFDLAVGYASHVDGGADAAVTLPAMAVAAGADVVEVHVTIDRDAKGPDYQSSLDPAPFAAMVERVRAIEPALGSRSLDLTPEELNYRTLHKKWAVAARPIAEGETIAPDAVALKRTNQPPAGHALPASEIVGRRTARPVAEHGAIGTGDLRTKVAAALACRAESSRMYGKPMQPVGDRPIIQHQIDQLRRVPAIDEIVLAISDGPSREVFVDYAEREGLKYVIGPEKDVLGRLIMAADAVAADVIVRTTTENPFLYWQNLGELIQDHVEQGADLSVTERLPLGTCLEVLSVTALKRSHQHGDDRHRSELCTLFIAENPGVFSIRRVPPPADLDAPDLRLTVDTPQDLIVVRALWTALHRDGEGIDLADIVRYLRAHPELAQFNAGEQTLYLWK